jgi:hypothetical protein
MIYVNFIVIVIRFSEKNRTRTFHLPLLCNFSIRRNQKFDMGFETQLSAR